MAALNFDLSTFTIHDRMLKNDERKEEAVTMKFKDMPYKRVDLDEIRAKYKELMDEMRAAKSGEEQFEVHKKYYEFSNHVRTQTTLSHIRHDVDMTDEFYNQEQEYYDQIMPQIESMEEEYKKLLYYSPYREVLEQKIGPVAFKNMELSMKSLDEKIIPLMQEENALKTRYNKLIATAKIDWEGETLNLSLMTPYLSNKDRSVRERAWQKYSAFFESISDELDEIYDALVKNRTEQARQMGYENFVELGYYRMTRNAYGKDEVEKFRDQVKKYFVPFAERLHEQRRERLGLEKLSYIDEQVYFKDGNPAPEMEPQEILETGRRMYAEMSEETHEFFDFMMENELFDVFGRKTKRAGGYMTYLPDYNSPFVFANFNGTSGDLDVITHECGHAFQGYVAAQDPIQEHWDITMETAEIHSMSMEFFADDWMDWFFRDRADDYRTMHLESAAIFIPYGCMVDEFQHIVYENPDMTPQQRKDAWHRLEQEYKPHLDYGDNAFFGGGGFWLKQQHIFNYPFYYIDYVLAQTCAFMYEIWMRKDRKAAWESYLKLCRLSAGKFYPEMLHEVGLEVPYEEGCMKQLTEELEKILL